MDEKKELEEVKCMECGVHYGPLITTNRKEGTCENCHQQDIEFLKCEECDESECSLYLTKGEMKCNVCLGLEE